VPLIRTSWTDRAASAQPGQTQAAAVGVVGGISAVAGSGFAVASVVRGPAARGRASREHAQAMASSAL
jgi:hypothetical protein